MSAYRSARSTARRRMTVQLCWQASRTRGRAHSRRLDEYELARFAAVRAELRARGREVPPLGQTVGRWV